MALRSTLLALVGVLALVPGCSRRPGRLADEPAAAYRALEVPGFLPAVLHVPRGEGPHPLIVAAHGAHGFPEDSCEEWVALTEGRAVVLCLRGARTDVTRPSGFYFATHHVLGRELDASLAALRKTDVPLARGGHAYTGFSQGAIMGAIVLVDRAAEFPRVAFVEGGFQYWSVARARRFAKNGGKRVLVVCGTAWCSSGSRDVVRWLRGAGVEVRLEYAPGAGHTSSGAVYDRTRAALPWLLGVDQGSR